MQFNFDHVGPILVRSIALARLMPVQLVVAFIVLTASGVGYDLSLEERPDSFAFVGILNTFILILMQIFVTRAATAAEGLDTAKRMPVMALFGQSIVSGLGILAGLLLLILPGLFVASRWFIAPQILVLENHTAMAALRESWERTEENWFSIFFILVLMAAGIGLPLSVSLVFEEWEWGAGTLGNLAVNMAISASYIFGYIAATVIWMIVSADESRSAEIFD